MTPPPPDGDDRPPPDPLSAAPRYRRPGHTPPDVPSDAVARADPTGAPSTGSRVSPLRTARVLGIVAIALWFFPCTLGCFASIGRGVLGQRKAAEQGASTLIGKVAWIGGLTLTVAEVVVFLTYLPGLLAARRATRVPLFARSVFRLSPGSPVISVRPLQNWQDWQN